MLRQAGQERQQEDGAEGAWVIRRELEDAGVAGGPCLGHVSLDGDDLPHVVARVLPGNGGRRHATGDPGEGHRDGRDGGEMLHGISLIAARSRRTAPDRVSASSTSSVW